MVPHIQWRKGIHLVLRASPALWNVAPTEGNASYLQYTAEAAVGSVVLAATCSLSNWWFMTNDISTFRKLFSWCLLNCGWFISSQRISEVYLLLKRPVSWKVHLSELVLLHVEFDSTWTHCPIWSKVFWVIVSWSVPEWLVQAGLKGAAVFTWSESHIWINVTSEDFSSGK